MANNQTADTRQVPNQDSPRNATEHYIADLAAMYTEWNHVGASFIVTSCGLLLLCYFLSILVAYLHIREYPVVFPLTCPTKGDYFIEYFILIKTSLKPFSALDAFQRGRLTLQLIGTYADSPVLNLKKPKGSEYFCTRGGINIFVYHSTDDLGEILTINIGLTNDAPYELRYVSWRPCFALVMRPSSKAFWGVKINKKLKTSETITEKFECKESRKDSNSIIKSVARFHNWLSMFNSPTRFGFYSNIVHTLMFFFTPVLIMCLTLVWQFVLTAQDFNNALPEFLTIEYVGVAFIAACGWLLQCIFEAFFRLSRPHYSCANIKFYKGLVESIESPFLLDDFLINYDWSKRRPLIPRYTVMLPVGTRHGYAQSIFSVKPPNSLFNMWGFLNQDEQREWSHAMRCVNSTALPLPFNVRWLAKEAWGCKMDVMLDAYDSNFTFEPCLFHTWLPDWPMDLTNEPQQAGLVFSNIIAKDLQVLIKMENKEARSRFARLCLFQWHGLMCALFMHIILIEADRRNEKISGIKLFMYKNLEVFSKRTPREIQAGWKKRKENMKQTTDQIPDDVLRILESVHPVNENMDLIGNMVLKGRDIKKFELATLEDDENMSAVPFKFVTGLLHRLFPVVEMADHPALTDVKVPHRIETRLDDCMDLSDFKAYEKDNLIFEYAGTRMNNRGSFVLNPYKNSKNTSLSGIGDKYHGENDALSCLEAGEPAGYYKEENEQHTQKTNRKRKSSWGMTDIKFRNRQSSGQASMEYYDSDKNNCALSKEAQQSDVLLNKLSEREKKRDEQEKIEAILKEKQGANEQDQADDFIQERHPCDLSEYEEITLGKSTNEEIMPVIDPNSYPTKYLRHTDEITGYCCSDSKCESYMQVHRKVGHSSLEILKKILTDLLCYAMDARYRRQSREKTWFRKKMVKSVFDLMHRKATMYDDDTFTSSDDERKRRMGFICNELMAQTLTVLKITVDVINLNRYVVKMIQNKEYETIQANYDRYFKLPPPHPADGNKRLKKCLFCAKVLKFQDNKATQGCDQMKKLVKFFSRDTCSVAEKEIHYEFIGKFTVQNYCAMVLNIAKKELLIELEDPPLVLISKVIRAMTHMLLVELQPKAKDVKDMNAEELRRMGTRRQRIQARHDTAVDKRLKESEESKRKKEVLQMLINETTEKWKVTLKTNELTYCTRLLAECLVQERFVGFTVYSGFISKDQETLLAGSRHHLGEMEIKAYNTIMTIGRKILAPQLKSILESSDDADVLFTSQKLEVIYLFEAINVLQFITREPFLGTCCYYIDDIVNVKTAEFLEFKTYMMELKQESDISKLPVLPIVKKKRFKTDFEPITIMNPENNSFTSPALRWGRVAIRGELLPEDLKEKQSNDEEDGNANYKAMVPEIMDIREKDPDNETLGLVYDLLYSRDVIQTHCDSNLLGNNTQLRTHLAKTQARLTDQIAVGAQSMADTFEPGSGYQRDFLQADLFNVEYYCTGKMKVPFGPTFGIIVGLIVIALTVFAFFYTMMVATHCTEEVLSLWLYCTVIAFAIHFIFLELLKALIYLVFGLFVDGYYK